MGHAGSCNVGPVSAPGRIPGQPSWADLVDHLVAEHGSLAQVAARLSETRGFREDAESIGRALRRLRARGAGPGGVWGSRLLATFGLPRSIDERLRFMGSYHSRFVDLPRSLGADLVQLWDRPPTSESRAGRAWLSLARAILASRAKDRDEARAHLATARAAGATEPAIVAELTLGEALVADPADVDRLLASVPRALEGIAAGHDADCLRARLAGQLAYAANQRGEIARGEELHRALPDAPSTAPFARSRRANGLAYARFELDDREEARRQAWLAARYAGDAGHVRLRAMALLMVARVTPDDREAGEARDRARAIAVALEDVVLASRCDASERARRR